MACLKDFTNNFIIMYTFTTNCSRANEISGQLWQLDITGYNDEGDDLTCCEQLL